MVSGLSFALILYWVSKTIIDFCFIWCNWWLIQRIPGLWCIFDISFKILSWRRNNSFIRNDSFLFWIDIVYPYQLFRAIVPAHICLTRFKYFLFFIISNIKWFSMTLEFISVFFQVFYHSIHFLVDITFVCLRITPFLSDFFFLLYKSYFCFLFSQEDLSGHIVILSLV